jgi:uncharacterized SAM-binding protein YcdF (DUF218 family)
MTLARMFSPLLQPLGIVWLLLVGTAALLAWRKRKRLALLLAGFAALISLLGSVWFPSWLLASLERPYVGNGLTNLPPCDAVVMLGGTHRFSRHDAFGLDLTQCADRIVTAVELMRLGKGRALVLGGNSYLAGGKKKPDAAPLQDWLTAWRVFDAPVIALGMNRNTREEALAVAVLAKERKWQRVILVTSAFHMRRAEATFQKVGVPVVCAACDFQAVLDEETEKLLWFTFNPIPRIEGFQMLGLYVHERLGWWAYRLRGWVGGAPEGPAAK